VLNENEIASTAHSNIVCISLGLYLDTRGSNPLLITSTDSLSSI